MKNRQTFSCIALSIALNVFCMNMPCHAISMTPSSGQKVVVNNRVITKVSGKPISVIDLMKKLDLMFYQEHSEHLDSNQARYQFYMAHWQNVLKSMIDRELAYLDAEAQNMPVSPGDVREEIEDIFGPDVLDNLEQAGLTYEEVFNLIKTDILIRRMITYAVNLKAVKSVTPEDIVVEYEQNKEKMSQELFQFRILSVKSSDSQKAQSVADHIQNLVNEQKVSADDLQSRLQADGIVDDKVTVTVSPLFTQKKNEFSPHVYELIAPLEENSCSIASVQKANTRLYYLEKKEQNEAPPLASVEEAIREQLVHKAMLKESELYFARLRKYYDVNPEEIVTNLPQAFKPFELK